MEAIRRALDVKLAALSQSVIARLIRNHDKEHRLEGFLKITQAAQTDALVRVLDDKLARYLAQVLEEDRRIRLNARGGWCVVSLAARGKRACAFVTRAHVETIQLAEVGIAHDLKAPQQRQAERPANAAHHFQYKRKAAQRLDANVNPRFFLSGFHLAPE